MENPYATPQSLAVDDLQIPPRLTTISMMLPAEGPKKVAYEQLPERLFANT